MCDQKKKNPLNLLRFCSLNLVLWDPKETDTGMTGLLWSSVTPGTVAPSPWDSPGKNAGWVVIPFSRGSSDKGIEPHLLPLLH